MWTNHLCWDTLWVRQVSPREIRRWRQQSQQNDFFIILDGWWRNLWTAPTLDCLSCSVEGILAISSNDDCQWVQLIFNQVYTRKLDSSRLSCIFIYYCFGQLVRGRRFQPCSLNTSHGTTRQIWSNCKVHCCPHDANRF